jgi:hypothetical protein
LPRCARQTVIRLLEATLEGPLYVALPVAAFMGLSCRVVDAWRTPMNTFYEHHRDSIRFGYRCFDRILLNGLIQPFQQPERVVGFFNTDRQLSPVSKSVLRDLARQYDHWVTARAKNWGGTDRRAALARATRGLRGPHLRRAGPDQVVIILKAQSQRVSSHRYRQGRPLASSLTRGGGSTVSLHLLDREVGCLSVSVRIFRSPPGCASISITGWPIA